jgi:hypothetical protein
MSFCAPEGSLFCVLSWAVVMIGSFSARARRVRRLGGQSEGGVAGQMSNRVVGGDEDRGQDRFAAAY